MYFFTYSNSFAAIKSELGLDEIKHVSVGAGPIHEETHKYFRTTMNLTLLGHLGMSESTLPQTTNLTNSAKIGSCGRSTNGVQVDILINDEYKDPKLLYLNKKDYDVGEVNDFWCFIYQYKNNHSIQNSLTFGVQSAKKWLQQSMLITLNFSDDSSHIISYIIVAFAWPPCLNS